MSTLYAIYCVIHALEVENPLTIIQSTNYNFQNKRKKFQKSDSE